MSDYEPIRPGGNGIAQFHQFSDDEPFTAMRRAERYIQDRRWAVGPSQGGAPRGIMFSTTWIIAKWRNLTKLQRDQCDAYLIGNGRYGPLTITTDRPSP